MIWIIAGAIIGVISGMIYSKEELCRLSREYQASVNWKNLILIVLAPFLGLFLSLLIEGWYFSFSTFALAILAYSTYSWGVSMQLTRYGLLRFYEKTENMRLMQSWWGGGIVLIPKAPEATRSQTIS